MRLRPELLLVAACWLLAAMPQAHAADRKAGGSAGSSGSGTSYCCNDEQGRQVCSDILPQICWGKAYREVDNRGLTVRRIDAPLTPEQRAARDAEARRKREQQRLAAEERRRNQALLDAYSSEKDIDAVRDRTLNEIEKSLQRASDRHAEALARHKELIQELQFYARKAPPKSLLESLEENESELRAHASVMESKQKELDAVRAKFEDEKRRYVELIRRSVEHNPAAATPQ
jgi:hypothetical protein